MQTLIFLDSLIVPDNFAIGIPEILSMYLKKKPTNVFDCLVDKMFWLERKC